MNCCHGIWLIASSIQSSWACHQLGLWATLDEACLEHVEMRVRRKKEQRAESLNEPCARSPRLGVD
jgi:hypothetical protein